MALNDDKIKDLFSSKLGGFEPEVPASIWGGLDQLLSQQAPIPDASSSSSQGGSAAAKSSALKTTLIAASVAATVAVGVYLTYNPSEVEAPVAVVEEVKEEVKAPVEEIVEENTIVLAAADFAPRAATKKATPTVQEALVEEVKEVREETKQTEAKEVEKVKEEAKVVAQEEEMLAAIELPKFLTEDISLSLRTNMGALSGDVSQHGGDLLFSRNDRSTEFNDVLKNENKEYELSHKQPISVGVTVSKKISRNMSLETGLMFTYLSSRIKSNSASNIKEDQVFGYLGIPIYLNYDFYEWNKAKFYLSLGGLMQKDVYGRYTSRLVGGASILNMAGGDPMLSQILFAERSYIKQNISQSHWQFSGHLNVGASYPIYRRLYIYTSVGGAYYFDAGNEYRTIFSDRKFQLDLNLGLRFDF